MSGLPSGSWPQIFHLPGFMKAQVGLASLLLIVQPLCAFSALQSQSNPSGQAGAAPVAEPKFRILRSVSGSKSSQAGGNFGIQDPRTVFYLPEDRQVIVYFEWEGPPGLHHLEGMWKNPEGKVVVVSGFDYEAKQRRFAGYWTLPLTEGVTPGLWALEAHVDGEVAGTHTFQITTGTHPTPVPERHPLGASEIYRKALASTVSIEALDSSGARLNFGSGFFIGKDTLLTGFEIIDGAGSARVTFPDGRRQAVEGIVSWSRLEDWMILAVASDDIPSLPLAGPNSWQVGDQCFSLDSEQEGNRTLVDGNITGQRDFPDVGNRLNLSFALTAKANGSPLLNEYGEVVGIYVHRSLLPGSASVDVMRFRFPTTMFSGAPSQERLGVPVALVHLPHPGMTPRSFSELAQKGLFTPPLVGYRDILRGTIARQVEHRGPSAEPVDEKFEFSRRDGEIVVFVHWDPKEKIKGPTFLRLYDLRGQLLGTSKARKVTMSPGHQIESWWELDISKLSPAVYRVDLVVDSDPAWRAFFRVAE